MNRPQGVRQAVLIIWATLAISAIAALFNTLLGHVGFTEFGFQIIFYALLCILPLAPEKEISHVSAREFINLSPYNVDLKAGVLLSVKWM